MARLSLVTPICNPHFGFLKKCTESIQRQSDQDFDWVVVHDGVHDHEVIEVLAAVPQVQQIFCEHAGISGATNSGIDAATGDFIGFLEQTDELHPDAISIVKETLTTMAAVDLLYTNEDKIDAHGRHFSKFVKPIFDRERLRHQNFVNHFTVLRKTIIDQVGGLKSETDGAQDWDLLLRCLPLLREVVRIDAVLYHWRSHPSSTASGPNTKPESATSGVRAVQDFLDVSAIDAVAAPSVRTGYVDTILTSHQGPISLVVPTRGITEDASKNVVSHMLESLLRTHDCSEIEVVLVVNEENFGRTSEWASSLSGLWTTCVSSSGKFNFARAMNLGVDCAASEIVFSVNDDIKFIQLETLRTLSAFFAEPDVGLVGPRLVWPNGVTQSVGHLVNRGGIGHAARGLPSELLGPLGVLSFPSQRSGVTFALAGFRKSDFVEVGRLNADKFPINFNDVDFGYQIIQGGQRIIVDPNEIVEHYESFSRKRVADDQEVASLLDVWGHVLSEPDPFLPDFWEQVLEHEDLSQLIPDSLIAGLR